ncbi:MAG: hypothetical protein II759_04310 [Lachnospiraceae bacterium]|nr:hypothetical protein [Lachnospiraceae bacterium]
MNSSLIHKIAVWVTSVILTYGGLTGCGSLELKDNTAELNGVKVTLENAEITEKNDYGVSFFDFRVSIDNLSGTGIMEVGYDLHILDGDGAELWVFSPRYYGETEAIPAGGHMDFDLDGYRRKLDGEPKAVSVSIRSVLTEEELPPVVLPEKGQLLIEAGGITAADFNSNPPSEIRIGIDQGGYLREAVFTEGNGLAEASSLLKEIRIGDEVDTFVTDNYNYIILSWEDGSWKGFSLNLHNYEVSTGHNTWHYYELEGLGGLLSFADPYLEEVEYESGGGS